MTLLLPRSRPEDQGVPSAALARLIAALDEIPHIHTMTVVRHGSVVAEFARPPYDRDTLHAMYSVSKSFTALAVGSAIDEGRFGLDDLVIDLLRDAAPPHPSDHHRSLTVRHLLTMTTGHDAEPQDWREGWARTILAADLPHEPGTHWLYNTSATYLLAEIVQRTTGERLLDYLTPRLFEPLGFRSPQWVQSPTGVDVGGFGLSIRAEELAAFGQLLLQRGEWNGRRLAGAEWIDQATSAQVASGTPGEASDWDQGYGFQFWRCRPEGYRADGAFGQFAVVLPEHDAVVALTGGLSDMQRPLAALWELLLPAFDTVEPPAEVPQPRPIPAIGGELRAAEATFDYDGPVRRLGIAEGVLTLDGTALHYAPDEWVGGTLPSVEGDEAEWYGDQVAASGGWVGDTFVVELRMLEDAVTFRLEVGPTGRLVITRDVGFDGSDVWSGDPVRDQSAKGSSAEPAAATADHHSVVSP